MAKTIQEIERMINEAMETETFDEAAEGLREAWMEIKSLPMSDEVRGIRRAHEIGVAILNLDVTKYCHGLEDL